MRFLDPRLDSNSCKLEELAKINLKITSNESTTFGLCSFIGVWQDYKENDSKFNENNALHNLGVNASSYFDDIAFHCTLHIRTHEVARCIYSSIIKRHSLEFLNL